MSYIDAQLDKNTNTIKVLERIDNKNVERTHPAQYVYYYEDPNGTYKSMWGVPCKKVLHNTHAAFQKDLNRAVQSGKRIHESDIDPVFRCLDEYYRDAPLPSLNVCFFDIEVDWSKEKGFAPVEDPFNRITAITAYTSDDQKLFTFVLKPDLNEDDKNFLSYDEADAICSEFEDCYLCEDEEQLLKCFLEVIKDVNILSGWNSEFFDIPYIVNRIKRILPKYYTKQLCLWDLEPKKRVAMKFGKEHQTYELKGRVHLDYLNLYRKHNTKEQHSYTLDHIGEIETGERKVQYAGTLDMLYKEDFRTFIDYSRQDVLLLVKIDEKKKYIQLSNQIAHQNCVLFATTMGSVLLVEQAITHEVHSRGMVVPSKKMFHEVEEDEVDYFSDDDDDEEDNGSVKKDEDIPAIGAYVAKPKTGLHKFIGAADVNSLYPSTIRSLNMSLETVFGQARTTYTDKFVEERLKKAKANLVWNDVFSCIEYQLIMDQTDDLITFDFIDGETIALSASEWYDFIFNGDDAFILSANGTLFKKDVDGVIPKLLEKWYADRKQLRKRSEIYGKLQTGIQIPEELLSKL